jgi:hypothetical protein
MTDPSRPLVPDEVLRLDPDGIDRLLDELESTVPRRAALFEVGADVGAEAYVFGDTHGDWRSTREVVDRSGVEEGRGMLIGLGDYVDRPPVDCPSGSVVNALFLLRLAARHPDRVVLIQGNHEGVRRVSPSPHHLPEEVRALWGSEGRRYARLLGLLERGPLAAVSRSGAYLAHAGFPRILPTPDWRTAFDSIDEAVYCEIAWAECAESANRRGAAPPWTERDLSDFLRATRLNVVLRAHDPDLTGRWVYGGRSLTLHTTRLYERFGGVLAARLPLESANLTSADVRVERLSTGRPARAQA